MVEEVDKVWRSRMAAMGDPWLSVDALVDGNADAGNVDEGNFDAEDSG